VPASVNALKGGGNTGSPTLPEAVKELSQPLVPLDESGQTSHDSDVYVSFEHFKH
jgi:hypothetical protein